MSQTSQHSPMQVYREIAVLPAHHIHHFFQQLTLEEKIFVYYLTRASAIGNRIATDQLHADGQEIMDLFQLIVQHEEKLTHMQAFLYEAKLYLVYLITNHSHYFNREDQQNKRTPNKLQLSHLTPEALIDALETIGISNAYTIISRLRNTIFDADFEPTLCVPDSIEKSAVNMYSKDFTESDYQSLDPQKRSGINTRCYLGADGKPAIEYYSTKGRGGKEFLVALHWLKKAEMHAEKYPQHFDEHFVKSLQFLIQFLETGEEEWFRKHSIEWLKTRSRIDYTFGFIESYDDPKAARGMFAAEITMKAININQLSLILPIIENDLPFVDAYKRESFDVPNASINVQLFGTGDYGPMKSVAAYCLPNYEDIRAQYGSKQIIYRQDKGLGQELNPELDLELHYSNEQIVWIRKYDPQRKALQAVETLLTILHETIGHASGKLAMHTFTEGDQLTIENKTYQVGNTIAVTNTNIKEFLRGYDQTIEELRAEIIALYVAINHIEQIQATSLLPELDHLNLHDLQEWLITLMAITGYRRLLRQPDNVTTVAGDHARANMTITNYLIACKAIKEVRQKKTINNIEYEVPALHVIDLTLAKECVKDLMIQVQTIKSTGDGQAAHQLITTYGTHIRDTALSRIMKKNRAAIMGDIKAVATLYPLCIPTQDHRKEIIDVILRWPNDIFDQHDKITHMIFSDNLDHSLNSM